MVYNVKEHTLIGYTRTEEYQRTLDRVAQEAEVDSHVKSSLLGSQGFTPLHGRRRRHGEYVGGSRDREK
jgi:hypothetical protein